ncbi:hypothetical protein SAMN05216255_1556 [Pseudomonas segetis]|uniref:Uncharacterized protein n=1 Tax=Pseudomonas segetis TaxID=298908 RepID=A0A239C9B4_9PSED|nr:hypothetical protein SAMN05216255_1556 [Pseudomonas segetis]
MHKRCWKISIPGCAPFTMILMDDELIASAVAKSIWPSASVS